MDMELDYLHGLKTDAITRAYRAGLIFEAHNMKCDFYTTQEHIHTDSLCTRATHALRTMWLADAHQACSGGAF